MDELEEITQALRKRREDLEALMADTSSRNDETTALMAKIENLRRRAEETRLRFEASVRESNKKK